MDRKKEHLFWELLEIVNNIDSENNLNIDEIRVLLWAKIWEIINKNHNTEEMINILEILDFDTDIVFTINENHNRIIYTFSLNNKWEEKLKVFKELKILKEILEEEINNKISFDALNNVLKIYNNSQKEDDKKVDYIYNIEDLEKIKELNISKKEVQKIERKEKRKKKIKATLKGVLEFDIWILGEKDIEAIIKTFDLEEKFKNKTQDLKTNFEYIEIIEKPKQLEDIKLPDEEKIEDKWILDSVNKHKAKVIWIVLCGIFYLYIWESKKVESNYNPTKYVDPMSVLSEDEKKIVIEKNFYSKVTTRIHTIIKTVSNVIQNNKDITKDISWIDLAKLKIELLEYQINELNSDLQKNNTSELSLSVKNDFKIVWRKIEWTIILIINWEERNSFRLTIEY